jgi:hypothetical protein
MAREIKTIEDDADTTPALRGIAQRARRLTAIEQQMTETKDTYKALKAEREAALSDLRSYIREQSEPLLPFEQAA